MPEVLFDINEKPNWERMVAVLQEFDEQEQQSIYNIIRGAQVLKRYGQKKSQEENHSA